MMAVLSQSLIRLLHVAAHFPQRQDRTQITELRFVFPYHFTNGAARLERSPRCDEDSCYKRNSPVEF